MNIFITGCSRGLGYALATQLSSMGITVHGTCRKEADVQRMNDVFGGEHTFHCCDATDLQGLHQVVDNISTNHAIDAAIINAGIINSLKNSWEIDSAEWKSVIDINVHGVTNAILALIPKFINQKKGTFIAISSGWGRYAEAKLAPYCASKFAVEGTIGSLAKELDSEGSGVTAIALDPGGGINTDMLGLCMPDSHAEYQTAESWARIATPYIVENLIKNKVSGSHQVPEK